MYKRPHFDILAKRLSEPRRFIQVLNGPRQVGKTTLVHQLLEVSSILSHFASADDTPAADITWIAQQWETARLKMKVQDQKDGILVIDEIQKVEDWSREVKKQWDKDTRDGLSLKVILLGSASLLIQQGLTESLAGRFELTHLSHWSLPEMQAAFDFTADKFVWFGGYPGAASLIKEEQRWKDYIRNSLVETTISKDILMLTRIQKPALLRRLFELACAKTGQIVSYNKMLGQLLDAGNTTTLSHYLDLLETAGLVMGLENFSPNRVRVRSSSPKLQVLNSALQSVFSPYPFEEARLQPNVWGHHVETAIGAHLANATTQSGMTLSYWRYRNYEVDFVLEKNKQHIAIEVKSGGRRKAPGLSVLAERHPPLKSILVGSEGLPWNEFLRIDPDSLF